MRVKHLPNHVPNSPRKKTILGSRKNACCPILVLHIPLDALFPNLTTTLRKAKNTILW